MKLAFVTVLAIALNAPYAIAQEAPRYRAIADLTSNPSPGETQPNVQAITGLVQAPGTGTPDNEQRTKPGGTRSEPTVCKQTVKPLTALVPIKSNESLTTAEHPIFWFYIPYAPQDIHSIEFSLHDREDTLTFYHSSLQLTQTPGVIGIPLPSSPSYSLKHNETYRWRLIVSCDQNATPEDLVVLNGSVTRVPLSDNVESQSDGIWHDELTNRAKRYLSEPQNTEVKNAWAELLNLVGLQELAQEPLVSSVSNPTND